MNFKHLHFLILPLFFLTSGCDDNIITSNENSSECVVENYFPNLRGYSLREIDIADLASEYKVEFLLDNTIYLLEVSGQFRLLKSENFGQTWRVLGDFPFASDFEFLTDRFAIITISDQNSANFVNSFAYSEDSGETWERYLIPTEGFIFSPRFEYARGFVFKCNSDSGFYLINSLLNQDNTAYFDTIFYENYDDYQFEEFVKDDEIQPLINNLVFLGRDSLYFYSFGGFNGYEKLQSVFINFEDIIDVSVLPTDGGYNFHAIYEEEILITGFDQNITLDINTPYIYLGSNSDRSGLYIKAVPECVNGSNLGTGVYLFDIIADEILLSDQIGAMQVNQINKIYNSGYGGLYGSYIIDTDDGIYYLSQN